MVINNNNPKKILGVGYPLSNSPYGYFNPTLYTSDQIKANLKNLILTRKGQRVMTPQFGTQFSKLLFQNNQQLGSKIITMIQTAVAQ